MGLYDLVFGCSHKHRTFPMTVRDRLCSEAASVTGIYVVCLECGKEFAYDWKAMKVVRSKAQTSSAQTPITILASHKVA